LAFDPAHLSRKTDVVKRAFAELTRMKSEMEEKDRAFETMLRDKADLDAELKRLRAEVAAARHQNEARPDNHDYSEAE
ncbi:hypothetical protein ACCT05_36565, partial [Rhizobium ruizarguesonis]